MQTVTAPGTSARTFLIHMFDRGLDDNRYVVERYKSTFDGEIVRWDGERLASQPPLRDRQAGQVVGERLRGIHGSLPQRQMRRTKDVTTGPSR